MARDSRTKKNDTKKDNTKKRKSTETKKKGMADPRAAIAVRLSSVLGGVRRFRQNPIQRYAKANGISMDQYPEELLSLYERNNRDGDVRRRISVEKRGGAGD